MSSIFKDTEAREWTVSLTVDSVMRVKDQTQVDLFDIVDGKLVAQLQSDPLLFGRVLFSLCKPQCEARGLSDSQFWQAMNGDVVEDAAKVVLSELINFSRRDLRPVLNEITEKTEKLRQVGIEKARQALNDPKREAALLAKIDKALNDLAPNEFGN